MSITKSTFGNYFGKEIFSYTLKNKNGMEITVLSYGGIIQKLITPDRNGVFKDIVCGYDDLEGYLQDKTSYMGALVGRYANRIGKGSFDLNSRNYKIFQNEKGVCHLHGGNVGFDRKVWDVKAEEKDTSDSLILTLFSPDMEEGYPGNLNVQVTYTLDEENALTIHYEADTDRDTVLNLTSHVYYNLNGYDGDSAMETELCIHGDYYDEVNELLLPYKEPCKVENTPFDFRTMRKIGESYDHNFILNKEKGEMALAAKAKDPKSGRTVTLYTDLPAMQLYTAGGMKGEGLFKNGVKQRPLHAFCMETQFSPDSPHRPYLPSPVLKKGEHFDKTAKFVFATEK